MLRKKSKKQIDEVDLKPQENPFRDALIQVFGQDQIEDIDQQLKKGKRKYRIKFTFKPIKEFLEQNPNFFDCSPEERHKRIVNNPFIDDIEDFQIDSIKYNIMSIKQKTDILWAVEYFDYQKIFNVFNGTKEEIIKFFRMNLADLYYISKVIIPKNNRADSKFYWEYKKLKGK